MALLFKKGEQWLVGGKKHSNEPLDEVAKKDPDYLVWILEEASVNLNDEAFYALEDAIDKEGIKIP